MNKKGVKVLAISMALAVISGSIAVGIGKSNANNASTDITVENGNTYSGEFSKGKTYIVVISTKNCSGREQGACCNQKDVGTTVIKK